MSLVRNTVCFCPALSIVTAFALCWNLITGFERLGSIDWPFEPCRKSVRGMHADDSYTNCRLLGLWFLVIQYWVQRLLQRKDSDNTPSLLLQPYVLLMLMHLQVLAEQIQMWLMLESLSMLSVVGREYLVNWSSIRGNKKFIEEFLKLCMKVFASGNQRFWWDPPPNTRSYKVWNKILNMSSFIHLKFF